ncbi:MAG: class I adenylate-forming enzyme family protein [Myxococcota bacterium]|nr:class I adenylate-forming enzyme family protein [Myxococcota bacterium]
MPRSLAERIAENAARSPDGLAYATAAHRMTWAEYEARSTALASHFVALGCEAGERMAVLLPDGPGVHAALVACEKAGLIAVGIGPRAGYKEIEHLLLKTGASGLVSRRIHEDRDLPAFARKLGLRRHVAVEDELAGLAAAEPGERPDRRLASNDVFLLNSTSGTTGMPKVVVHDQDRWYAFHELAVATGDLSNRDVFMSVVAAPFGFGIWTSHVTPTVLGAPTIVSPRFSAEETLELIERHRVSVLAAVSTQFVMLLESPQMEERDLSSLRVLYTGGEVVPSARAAEFEERTGAAVLQFYGSNETGALCGTSLRDDRERRLHSSGRVVAEMNVRLFDEAGADVTQTGRGQPGCKGPTLSRGYWEDDVENANLVRPDGWMLLGDIVTIDEDDYLSVIGRTDDFIIRGGKNISGPAVEQEVAAHPAVSLAAAVAMPDPVFGERVCAYVELRPGTTLTLAELTAEMRARDVSKENLPERLEILDALPRGSGGKVAKQKLREDIRRRLEAADEHG